MACTAIGQDVPFATVQGTITELNGRAPVAGAAIILRSVDGQEVTGRSAEDGRFHLENVPAGLYDVRIAMVGFLRPGRSGGWQRLAVGPGQLIDGLDVRLVRSGTISGRVTDENRDALVRARVEALQQSYVDGRKTLRVVSRAETDDRGDYRLYGLLPGPYQVRATASGYPPMYFGINNPLPLEEGVEIAPVDFAMLPVDSVSVSGSIVDSVTMDKSVVVSEFVLVPRNPIDAFMTITLPNRATAHDKFELRGVPPGSFYLYPLLTYQGITYSGAAPDGPTQLDVGVENVEDVSTEIQAGQEIHGRVSIVARDPDTVLALSGLEIQLHPANGLPPVLEPKSARVDETGQFQLSNVAAGDYNVVIGGLAMDSYLQSVNDHEPADGPIHVSNETKAEWTVRLSEGAGRIQGIALGRLRLPIANATVVLAPADRDRRGIISSFKVLLADQNGVFEFRGITPGNYKLFSWEDVETGAYFDPDFLDTVEPLGQAVAIVPGAVLSLQTTVIPQ